MSDLKIGSLFSGVGGLDLGVQSVLGGRVAWHVEIEKAPSKVLAHHWPNTPNYGDITSVNWAQVEPIDILTGGFPCQDVSLAGSRAGLNDATRSGLWAHYAHAIAALNPKLVVIENVRGLLSASAIGAMESDPWGMGNGEPRSIINALGAVLGDMAGLGYNARWCGVRAADAGAPHGRYRIFIVAHPSGDEPERWGGHDELAGTPETCESGEEERERVRDAVSDSGSTTANTRGLRGDESDHLAGQRGESANRASVANEHSPRPRGTEWGAYEPAIRRWEQVLGRTSPPPTNPDGRDMQHRLSPEFVEWMMGLPAGHVTAPSIGLTRNQQLKALGNGVVPAQCALALQELGL
jgi:DNA (cytosine-5)-methyltransferase 1